MTPLDLVTGAFGFTGSRIAQLLLTEGHAVRTLTRRSAGHHPLASRVELHPARFDQHTLGRALVGVDTVYVTYWMRFPRAGATWATTVGNVARLAAAAHHAGARRMVFISVTNARHDSPTAYFRAKAQAEDAVRAAAGGRLSLAIVRPTLLYGPTDILINNMAWTLRRLPVFGIPGDGRYRVQPVHADDVAELCLRLGRTDQPIETDAAGPETFTFDQLVDTVRSAVGSGARLVHLPVGLVLASTRLIGLAVRDVVLTRDELRELTESLLVGDDPAGTCPRRFSEWVRRDADALGRRYSSELARNFRLEMPTTSA